MAGLAGTVTSTICAVASPPGASPRAVLRVSGPATANVLRGLGFVPADRGAFAAELEDGVGLQPALVLWMPGPASYTREDVAELHVVGSPPLTQTLLERVLTVGARLAEPGEFTRRAFQNGRLDLTRAEGVLQLVHAANEEERRAAASLLTGGLDERVAALRERLDTLRAVTEASLDFDETDTGHIPQAELAAAARKLAGEIESASRWESRRERDLGLPRVVLAGPPNAGKSSLFNRLTGGGAAPAIVSDEAGTTRDWKEARWRIGDREVLLCDTAGLEEGDLNEVELAAQGQRASLLEQASLVIAVVDARTGERTPGDIEVWNQVDRAGAQPRPAGALAVSATTGAGLEELAREVDRKTTSVGSGRELSARHLTALSEAAAAVDGAIGFLGEGAPLDLFAEELRAATGALDRITGETTPEDVLTRIFSQFCLGK